MSVIDEAGTSVYSRQVGERLRVIRKQKRLSLQEVEAQSNQEFKASVLGAYERGERALSVPRLDRLSQFYAVPVEQLLPREVNDTGNGSGTGPQPEAAPQPTNNAKLAIDLAKLVELTGPPFEILARYLERIQEQRHEVAGGVITVRSDDARSIAAMLDIPVGLVADRLRALHLLVDPAG